MADVVERLADECVQRDRDVARRRVQAAATTGRAINGDLLGQVVDPLVEQVRDDSRVDLARLLERLWIACGGKPDVELGLQRRRIGADLDRLAVAAGSRDLFSPPQPPNGFDAA